MQTNPQTSELVEAVARAMWLTEENKARGALGMAPTKEVPEDARWSKFMALAAVAITATRANDPLVEQREAFMEGWRARGQSDAVPNADEAWLRFKEKIG